MSFCCDFGKILSLSGNFGTKVILDAERGESVKVTAVILSRDIFERNQIWLVTLPTFRGCRTGPSVESRLLRRFTQFSSANFVPSSAVPYISAA